MWLALTGSARFCRAVASSGQRCREKSAGVTAAASLEQSVRDQLKGVLEPCTGQSLLTLGCVHRVVVDPSVAVVSLGLDLLVAGHPSERSIVQDCIDRVRELNWVRQVHVEVLKSKAENNESVTSSNGLAKIKHIIAVSSCKGGVGKSTVAANVALSLASRGLRTGLLDADVYGPSIHVMIDIADKTVKKAPDNPKMILPLEGPHGLKTLSFGHVNPRAGVIGAGGKEAAIMRGPIASRVINQLVALTQWGELDYLIVDFPPGTGDVQITLCQTLAFAGAIIVTTPHELALVDAVKGISMFEELKVPTLALAENMAYFECDQGNKFYPFGKGGRKNILRGMDLLSSQSNEKNDSKNERTNQIRERLSECPIHSFPLSSAISGQGLNVTSYRAAVAQDASSDYSKLYSNLCDDVILEILKLQVKAQIVPSVTFVEGRGIVLRYFTPSHAIEYSIAPSELRCRDPKTGGIITDSSSFKNIKPLHFDFKGNYGVAIYWSDGHYADIYPYDVLKKILQIL